ncbi:hypothetical protein PROFUN_09982 [Planoprotostelium fungivorum]|uniref:Uncharacterized protein n=1 Tax=Planoprotostelium fungivorum TaxID=1890364 RepID=A0A2P6NFI0_9EUKA|nr:hypothetical protein PROFUN_09982 [Planoprotostelium fungivorum]
MIEFEIPLRPEDLSTHSTKHEYHVTKETRVEGMSEGQMNKLIDQLALKLKKEAALSITDHEQFDPLWSLLSKLTDVAQYPDVLERLYNLLFSSTKSTLEANKVAEREKDAGDCDTLRNALKMYVFFLHWFLTSAKKLPSTAAGALKKKRGPKSKEAPEQGRSWETEGQKESILATLISILDLKVHNLWRHDVPEESFLLLVPKIGYLFMEDSSVKTKSIRLSLNTLFSTLIGRYGQSAHVANSMIEMINKYDYMPGPAAEMIEHIYHESHDNSLCTIIIREISRISSKDLERDANGSKNIAAFLVECSERMPKQVYQNISLVISHLDGEAYIMRSGIIQVLGNIICKYLNEGDHLDAADSLMDILEERTRDVKSFTRSKALHVWEQLIQERKVPVERMERVLDIAIGRVQDTTLHTRRSAIQLLICIIAYNPYSPQLRLAALVTRYEEEQKKKAAMTGDDDNQEIVSVNLKKLEDIITFVEKIHAVTPVIAQILSSKNSTEIQDAIQFFVTCHDFKIQKATSGVRKMMSLVWSSEAGIKEKVIQACRQLYIKEKADVTAKNLIRLTEGCTLGELTCMEEMVARMTEGKLISQRVVQCLWDLFVMKNHESKADSTSALVVISMIAAADAASVSGRLNTLVSIGLGPRCKVEDEIGKYTCITLQKISKGEKEGKKSFSRMKMTHPLFTRLADLMNDDHMQHNNWYGFAEQAINTIYSLSERPDTLAADIVRDMAAKIFDLKGSEEVRECSQKSLGRFLFVLGHIALKQLVYIEEIQSELRTRRGNIREKKEKESTSAIEEELGVHAAEEEREVERLQETAEREVIGKNLLGSFGPLISMVAANAGGNFNEPSLRSCAVMALCKYMCVHSEYCDRHIQLLFTILANAPEPTIRANIIISLGDIAIRFPNLMEPWTKIFYRQLKDEDVGVRKNTLMVLTHLILNDMIKVKGQISDMAVCLEDPEERIVDLSKLFFMEYSKKGNSIYNVLPDLISNLSSSQSGDSFRSIMKYLFSFIKKDKHTENLVDKLCQRVKASEEEQRSHIFHCMTLLNLNEKAVKKLVENSKVIRESMSDPDVQNSIASIVAKCKKNGRSEMKAAVNELSNNLSLEDAQQQEGTTIASEERKKNTSKRGRSTRGRGRGGKRVTKGRKEESEEEGEYQSSSEEEARVVKVTKGKKKKEESSEEESSGLEDDE